VSGIVGSTGAKSGIINNTENQLMDITSSFTSTGSPWSIWGTCKAFYFNGFVFLQAGVYAAAASLAQHENFAQITNSAYYPSYNASFVTVNHQGEAASEVKITANQQYIQVRDIYNTGDSTFRVNFNGWYQTK